MFFQPTISNYNMYTKFSCTNFHFVIKASQSVCIGLEEFKGSRNIEANIKNVKSSYKILWFVEQLELSKVFKPDLAKWTMEM